MNNDEVLSPPVGKYRTNLGIAYSVNPYYALRKHVLPHARRRQLQALILFLGELQWININEKDLVNN